MAAWRWLKVPPQNSCLGGQVGIHGGGCARNWTLGCVALANDDTAILLDKLEVGDIVEILP